MGQGRHGNGDDVQEDAGIGRGAAAEADMDDPAVAFAALRTTVEGLAAGLGREMATIRRGVETALTRFEAQDAPTDYSADLGRIVQQLGALGERLQAVEQSPVLRHGAEHYALALERGGAGLVRTAVQGMNARRPISSGSDAALRLRCRARTIATARTCGCGGRAAMAPWPACS